MKYTNNSEQSQVRLRFACDECGIEWIEYVDRDGPVPECFKCAVLARKAIGAPALLGAKSQAIDIAWEAAQAMGMTDMNDNQRVGDVAFKPPPPPTAAELDQMQQQSAEIARQLEVPALSSVPQIGANGAPIEGGLTQAQMGQAFWGAGSNQPVPQQAAAALIGSAQVGSKIARREGSDPIAMLHYERRPFRVEVVAADHKRPRMTDI